VTVRALYELAAPAKLNLFLHVVGRRPDGYHLLQSIFVLVDWADTLHVERRDDGALRRHDLGVTLPADDLCLRAARALQSATGCTWGADISIAKHIPSGAGMGGGSSDAATTLLALNRLWGLNLPRARLLALALTLGADVPFFIGGDNAFVEGIGERLTPITLPPMWVAVVKPPSSLSTQAIFTHPSLVRSTGPAILSGSLVEDCAAGRFGHNDLQPPAEGLCPEVGQAVRWLERRFGNARMTGSGSAVFARAGTGDSPVATLPMHELAPGWVGRMCRSLPHHPLREWAEG
jgi:4-diphosphocytidyl-2-C-methyl-D-erythritol kinase